VNFLAWRFWEWVSVIIGLCAAGVGAYFLARWSWRWLLWILAIVVAVVFLVLLPMRYPPQNFLDPDLPSLFLDFFWGWVLVFIFGILFSTIYVVRTLRSARPAKVETSGELAGRFPDLESAWDEIVLRLSQAQIDLGSQHVFLVIAPNEDWVSSLVHSGGIQLFAQAPDLAGAPIHAYATGDGVLLSASGASAFGSQDAEGALRLESLCRRLLAQNPDCPVVRGVVVVFPITWAGQPESVKWAAALRDDLRTVQRTLKVRCPVFALFTEMEATPGLTEFAARMSPALRQSRCGFAVPGSQVFSGDLVQRGFVWMSGWFHGWVLNLMSEDPLNQPGNSQLFSLDHEIRRYRKRLRSVLEAAFSTHRETEPVLFRGCYFVATGGGPNEQAFAGGLLRSPRGRIYSDHTATEWTREAEEDDRSYRRIAMGVGLGGAFVSLLAWAYIIMVTRNPWWWIGPACLLLAWVVAAVRLSRW
jgi:type VI secretion system protein ImpL